MNSKIRIINTVGIYAILFCQVFLSVTCCHEIEKTEDVASIPVENINIKGELSIRIAKNFDRLEEARYQPEQVFLTEEESGNWPGDTEGRTILGLVLDARASKRTPKYLLDIIEKIPYHLNEEGYMGLVYNGVMNEQQLSGNGWMLRGLCEYYEWKKDEKVLQIITSIANHLFVKGKGFYKKYPIDPSIRNTKTGNVSGSIQNIQNEWMLSSDIGCVFIGMEGAIHAYKHLRTAELKEVIQEMIDRFLEMDLIRAKAQTHASLTACRGLIRYAEITGEQKYIEEAAKRWQLYRTNGMTENYENYNWFGRFDTWTESCAVVDAYMLSVQLWKHTHEPHYLNDAIFIYYNGICHTQRYNGGFGCDNCPGKHIHDVCLRVHADEAYWCCTMRGGEGLSRAAEYTYFLDNDATTVYIPFFHESEISFPLEKAVFKISQQTNYPFEGKVSVTIEENTAGKMNLKLMMPPHTSNHRLQYNGKPVAFEQEAQFVVFGKNFNPGDCIELNFDMDTKVLSEAINPDNADFGQLRLFYGPLMLGCENSDVIKLSKEDKIVQLENNKFKIEDKDIYLTPIYHLMDPKVWKDKNYRKQILF